MLRRRNDLLRKLSPQVISILNDVKESRNLGIINEEKDLISDDIEKDIIKL